MTARQDHELDASTRGLVAAGDVAAAARALGRPHRVEGTAARARQPAAERLRVIKLRPAPDAAAPADGAYAGWLVRLDDDGSPAGRWPAAIWVGAGPAPDGWQWAVRIHPLEEGELDLEGRHLGVEFASRVSGQLPSGATASLAAEQIAAVRAAFENDSPPARPSASAGPGRPQTAGSGRPETAGSGLPLGAAAGNGHPAANGKTGARGSGGRRCCWPRRPPPTTRGARPLSAWAASGTLSSAGMTRT